MSQSLQDISDIENKLKAMVTEACKQMLEEILLKKEEEIFKIRKYIKKGKVSLYIYSQFGQVTYYRYKAKDRDGKFSFPLDKKLGIEKSASFTPNICKKSHISYHAISLPAGKRCSIL